MDYKPLNVNSFISPITTGAAPRVNTPPKKEVDGKSFDAILNERLARSSVEFSKHAALRVAERNISVSDDNMERLSHGIDLAKAKGLRDPLILVDKTAYIVNVPANKVITTVGSDEIAGNVFTNIDGTVII